MQTLISNINAIIWSIYVLVPLLLIASTYFTIKTKAIQIRSIPHTLKLLRHSNVQKDENSVSSFQAFIVGLASRVGTGNLAGVAIALVTGGPGAIFWMWLAVLFSSVCAFVESTLAQLYKVRDQEKKYRGGPAYYIKNALGKKKLALAFAFSYSIFVCLSIIAIQANTITKSISNIVSSNSNLNQYTLEIIIGMILTLVAGYIILGGAKKIISYSTIVVSIMAVVYLLMASFVVIMNLSALPAVFHLIVSSAFDPQSISAGTIGGIISVGFKRGLFSSEAGLGSTPNGAASADVKHPVVQGLIQSLGALIDTLVICTLTACIILISNTELVGTDGITITQKALFITMGNISGLILTISVVCFAFSTILGVYFYAQANFEFINSSASALVRYKYLVITFVFIGAVTNSELLWSFGDFGNGITALINVFVILKLSKQLMIVFNDYQQQLKNGIKEPVFDASKYPELAHLEIWQQKSK